MLEEEERRTFAAEEGITSAGMRELPAFQGNSFGLSFFLIFVSGSRQIY